MSTGNLELQSITKTNKNIYPYVNHQWPLNYRKRELEIVCLLIGVCDTTRDSIGKKKKEMKKERRKRGNKTWDLTIFDSQWRRRKAWWTAPWGGEQTQNTESLRGNTNSTASTNTETKEKDYIDWSLRRKWNVSV